MLVTEFLSRGIKFIILAIIRFFGSILHCLYFSSCEIWKGFTTLVFVLLWDLIIDLMNVGITQATFYFPNARKYCLVEPYTGMSFDVNPFAWMVIALNITLIFNFKDHATGCFTSKFKKARNGMIQPSGKYIFGQCCFLGCSYYWGRLISKDVSWCEVVPVVLGWNQAWIVERERVVALIITTIFIHCNYQSVYLSSAFSMIKSILIPSSGTWMMD